MAAAIAAGNTVPVQAKGPGNSEEKQRVWQTRRRRMRIKNLFLSVAVRTGGRKTRGGRTGGRKTGRGRAGETGFRTGSGSGIRAGRKTRRR